MSFLYTLAMRISAVLLIGMLLMSCSTAAQPAQGSIAAASQKQSASDIVATVGSTSITLAQADDLALMQPADGFRSLTLLQAMFEARRGAIDELVSNALLDQEAKARGGERKALLESEVSSKVSPPTDDEIAAWYQANPQRVQGRPLEQVRAPIRAFLVGERTQNLRQALLDRLKAKTTVAVMLAPLRLTVHAGNSPTMGPPGAAVEIIEFSDFQCPYCVRATPTLKQVRDTYGNRIRLVYRNYPLEGHANAKPAAEAAQCANEQGQFWPYHDRLFADPKKLVDDDGARVREYLKQNAAELGLDAAKFNACFETHKYQSVIESDTRDGAAVGVSGTPAFFINGRPLVGALPFEEFKRVIDEELKKSR